MLGTSRILFSELVGTLAMILAVSGFIGNSEMFSKWTNHRRDWKMILLTGIIGGVIGIYGNLTGVEFQGAVISIRDIGPMLSGLIGGPIAGAFSGLIAGVHRLTKGGITAEACIVATILIGTICGIISGKKDSMIEKPIWAFFIGVVMETMHLCIVMIMVRPFETAWMIVRTIAIPFVLANSIGFMVMATLISFTKRHRRILLEKNRMESELGVATIIQHQLLPPINENYPGRPEIDVSASMEAAKEVGGDFYDVFYVDADRIAFLVSDVSGKGVPAALFMANSKIVLQNCIRNQISLSEAIETANMALCARNEADMFITAWVGVLDLKTNVMTYISAGHNPPVLCHDGQVSLLQSKRCFVLGGMEGIKYRENSLQMEPGDLLFIYTDGIVEAETAEHELFGEERLLRCFRYYSIRSAAKNIEVVQTAVKDFVRENSQFDDMTMLCLKIRETEEQPEESK